MAPPKHITGTDWASWPLSKLEEHAADVAAVRKTTSASFNRALSAARARYAAAAREVPRRPLAWGITMWGPIPGTRDTWLTWVPGEGLTYCAEDPAKSRNPGMPVRHRALAGPYSTLRDADRAARRFVGIGLDNIARGDQQDLETSP